MLDKNALLRFNAMRDEIENTKEEIIERVKKVLPEYLVLTGGKTTASRLQDYIDDISVSDDGEIITLNLEYSIGSGYYDYAYYKIPSICLTDDNFIENIRETAIKERKEREEKLEQEKIDKKRQKIEEDERKERELLKKLKEKYEK